MRAMPFEKSKRLISAQFQLFLEDDTKHSWSIYQINNIPTAINGFNIVMVMLFSIYSDATGRRMLMIMLNIVSLALFVSDGSMLIYHRNQ